MSDELLLRKNLIGGEASHNDFLVIWGALIIGRIHKSVGMGGARAWSWSCALPNVPQPAHHRGRAGSLQAAKVGFRRAWQDLQSRISHAEIEEAKARAMGELEKRKL